ncbi:hypothetical protein RND71_013815 [Anisodus tanguticus]|uniref:Oberon-like PHD finger domain-containing protein n=1 Tax=Anisodus tanguticus TaxID=243964 RepID=A0AAE1VN46_9SOLA|nr:hypothetical protein RND71_013815 [Anisodus tanguticus]
MKMEPPPSDSPLGAITCKAGNGICSSLIAEKPFLDYIRYEATVVDRYICGHIAHVDCALRAYMAGTVGGSSSLDAEYFCRYCDSRTDLVSHALKLLNVCTSVASRADIEKILNVLAFVFYVAYKKGVENSSCIFLRFTSYQNNRSDSHISLRVESALKMYSIRKAVWIALDLNKYTRLCIGAALVNCSNNVSWHKEFCPSPYGIGLNLTSMICLTTFVCVIGSLPLAILLRFLWSVTIGVICPDIAVIVLVIPIAGLEAFGPCEKSSKPSRKQVREKRRTKLPLPLAD